jgi:flagellar biosynthesis protein FlhA
VTVSPEWENAFADSLSGPPDDRQLAMAPTQLQAFIQRLRAVLDDVSAGGEAAVLLTSAATRPHVRAIVERVRPATPVLAQSEISARAKIKTVGAV